MFNESKGLLNILLYERNHLGINSSNMDISRKKQILIAFASSLTLLTCLFVITMLQHEQGIDYAYLTYAVTQIAVISLIPAIIVALFKMQSLLKSSAIGLVVGFIMAIAYVQIYISI